MLENMNTTSKYLSAIIILMAIAVLYLLYKIKKERELSNNLADTAYMAMEAANRAKPIV